jgi:cyclophilin family peptidyl-prolyl cis-trans isomerase
MLRNKLVVLLSFLLITVILSGCGEKTDSSKTEDKSGTKTAETKKTEENKTAAADSLNSNQTEKEDGTKMDATETAGKEDSKNSSGDIVNMETSMGNIKIKLFSKEAPITTTNFKNLINKGFYDGIIFHRVIDGFMLQGGDPTGTGTGGSEITIQDEFAPGLKHSKKGMLSMANRGPNTGTSQFFITLAPTPWLDGKHAIFGEVIGGMDIVDKIGQTQSGPRDKPGAEIEMSEVGVWVG